ncbi:YciI family protein [Rhodococcus sp. G-MC3]|uniref:YciI family protein n=1 Tax=Rhodococcus sp. G-MC3 TaxID=3046209 RepID=UPI0024BA5904|nr:YciI family protein [Rhodococcus sp. G-MC3]MDJ0391797.1 YciI family protein [Rhodococcus sp. G-MC3]
MALFAVHYTYSPSTTDGRDAHRASHRAWLANLLEQKVLVSSGPYVDGSGALIIVEGTDVESVRGLFAQDPFAVENLVESSNIAEWNPVMGAFA